jgi:uncharacterized coiled-coil protein SlyX
MERNERNGSNGSSLARNRPLEGIRSIAMGEMCELHKTIEDKFSSIDNQFSSVYERMHDDGKVVDGRLTEVERTVDTLSLRATQHELEFAKIQASQALTTEKLETLKERMPTRDEWTNMKQDIKLLLGKGGRSFDRIKDILLTAILTGVASFVVAKLLNLI